MRRLLSLLVVFAVLITAVVPPAYACAAPDKAIGTATHDCCAGERAMVPVPAGVCCTIGASVADRTVTEIRYVHEGLRDLRVDAGVLWWLRPPGPVSPPHGSIRPSRAAAPSLPIYLQQLALLI